MNRTEDPEEKIVVAARRVFVEKGYENASMSDIPAAAGINRTALHYYFRTKDKIFQAVFGSLIGPFIPKVQDILHSDAPFFDKMDRLIDEYFEVFSQNPFLPRFVMNESGRDVRHLVEVAESIGFRTYISTLVELLETEMAAGRISRLPVHVVFLTFIGQVMFPFLSRNLICLILEIDSDRGAFEDILTECKRTVSCQMRLLLDKDSPLVVPGV